MTTRRLPFLSLLLASSLALGCASEAAPVEAPPPPPPDPTTTAPPAATTAPEPATTAAPTGAPTASAPPIDVKPPPRPLKDVLGKVASIEVREVEMARQPDPVKSTRKYDKVADIDAILKAIGVDQTATGPKRRCPDDVQVIFTDDARTQKGVLGLCGKLDAKENLEGGEFGPDLADRAGITLADAPGLKKALAKSPPIKPKKDAPKADAPKKDAPAPAPPKK